MCRREIAVLKNEMFCILIYFILNTARVKKQRTNYKQQAINASNHFHTLPNFICNDTLTTPCYQGIALL